MSQGRWVPIPALAFVTFPTPTQKDRRGRLSLRTDGLHVRGQSRTPVPTDGRLTYPRTVEDAGPYIQTIFASKKAERRSTLPFFSFFIPQTNSSPE